MVIAREITKRFETIERVPLASAAAWVAENPDRTRGEFVLVIEARQPAASANDPMPVLEALLGGAAAQKRRCANGENHRRRSETSFTRRLGAEEECGL